MAKCNLIGHVQFWTGGQDYGGQCIRPSLAVHPNVSRRAEGLASDTMQQQGQNKKKTFSVDEFMDVTARGFVV